MQKDFPIIPTFLLKYKFATNEYITNCKMPIAIFHGDADEMIPYDCSVQLMKLTKPTDELITLKGRGHNGMSDNPEYVKELKRVLEEDEKREEGDNVEVDEKLKLDSIFSLNYNTSEKASLDKFTVKIKVKRLKEILLLGTYILPKARKS